MSISTMRPIDFARATRHSTLAWHAVFREIEAKLREFHRHRGFQVELRDLIQRREIGIARLFGFFQRRDALAQMIERGQISVGVQSLANRDFAFDGGSGDEARRQPLGEPVTFPSSDEATAGGKAPRAGCGALIH